MLLEKYKEPLYVFSFVIILFVFLFGGVLGAGYILDDHSVIENREELRGVSAVYKVFTLPWHQNQPWAGNYRPLTLFSYALSLSFSESTAILRFINIVIHAANAALVFYLVRMFYSGKFAYFTAIGFAVLPINTGTILSLVGRSDLFSAFFILLSIILFFKDRYGYSVLIFFLALLAKDFSIFLLPVIVLLSLFSKGHELKKTLKTALRYSLALVPYFALRYLALGTHAFNSRGSIDPIIGPLAFAGFKERMLTGFAYFYLYLRKTFLPFDLSPDYSFNQIPIPKILSPNLIIGLILLLAILVVFFKNRDRNIKVPIIFFLVIFGAISNTVLVTTGTFAERWWYLPSVGLFWFASAFMRGWFNDKGHFKFLFYPLILAAGIYYLYASFEQAGTWTSERELFVVAAQRSPNSAWARTNLAAVYFKEKKFDLAETEIGQSLKITEKYPAALNIYAKLKWRNGEFKEARSAFERAVEYDLNRRNNRDLYRSLAILMLETREYGEAERYIKNALNSLVFRDANKAIYLDNLLFGYIDALVKNKSGGLPDSEKKIVEALIAHIKGF
ncbi:MAG TPA: hypothetical protein VI978_01485 [Candidatus Paceibacterota bacterium]